MGIHLPESCLAESEVSDRSTQLQSNPRPKNRVWGFSSSSGICTRRFPSQPLELHRETVTTTAGTASGIVDWLSNDPIGISGGLNQYVFCANTPVNFRDPFGNMTLAGFIEASPLGVGIMLTYSIVKTHHDLNTGGIEGTLGVTIRGTGFTFYGDNYDGLSPAAQQVIRWHEARHQSGRGEECARKGTVSDVDLLLNRGTIGDLLGQGGRPLTPTEIAELNKLKTGSQIWLYESQLTLWERLSR